MAKFAFFLVGLLFLLVKGQSDSAWINEIHYDNSGTDTNEFVEVAYTSSLNITGYTVVLYSGNGGTWYNYQAVPQGTLVGNIYLSILNYPVNGIENGGPDGIALVNSFGSVVEFLSYEGTMVAADGPAMGRFSTDMLVSETSTTLVSHSLQRGGSGCRASDFTWQSPRNHTKGDVNSGQTILCGSKPPPTQKPSLRPTEATTSLPTTTLTPKPTKDPTPPSQAPNTLGVKFMTYNIKEGEVGNWHDDNNQLLDQYLTEFNSHFSSEVPYEGSTVQGTAISNSANAIMTRFPIVQTTQLTEAILNTDLAHDLMAWKLNAGNGKFVWVFGIHLKCCGGTKYDVQRQDNMAKLLAWIDANTVPTDGVILAGDFNSVSPEDTDPSYPGYQSGFEPSIGSDLGDGPMRILLSTTDERRSMVHTFRDAFRLANPTCTSSGISCCADTLCDSSLRTGCPERGYTYVNNSNNYDSRIDFIVVNQHVIVSGLSTVGVTTFGNANVCTASDHLPVDVILDF